MGIKNLDTIHRIYPCSKCGEIIYEYDLYEENNKKIMKNNILRKSHKGDLCYTCLQILKKKQEKVDSLVKDINGLTNIKKIKKKANQIKKVLRKNG